MNVSIWIRLLAALAVAGIIVMLSIVPGQAKPGDSLFVWLAAATPPTIQKLMHVAAYGLLAFMWMWSLADFASRTLRITVVLALSLTLGAALEWYQTMVPGRFGSAMDVVLNAVGAALGIVAAVMLL